MKITTISDSHTNHDQLIIDPTDMLIHAGDFSFQGRLQETIKFLQWIEVQPAKYRIFIEGNHDGMGDLQPSLFKELLKEHAPTTIFLRNEGCEIEGIKIWGRQITPTFGEWFHMADPQSPKMLKSLSIIPSDINILINHGPAYGILDRTNAGENVGCMDLLNELDRFKSLKLHIVGHIHEAAGQIIVNGVTHINASVLNERYINSNKPIIFNY